MSVKTILFVEDDPLSMAMYHDPLERAGFHLECASDGLAAFKILSNLVPDLILLDLNLPKFDGIYVLKYLQADPRLNTVPVVILSNTSVTDIVPPESPLSTVVQGTRRLLKTDCTIPKLLGTIKETLATAPKGEGHSNGDSGNGDDTAFGGFVWVEPKGLDGRKLSREALTKEAEERYRQLEDALAGLQKEREGFQGKLDASQQENKELQARIRDGAAELDCIKTGLKHQVAEWKRLENDLRAELEAARTASTQNDSALKDKEARCAKLEKELVELRKAREESEDKLSSEQESAAKFQQQAKELQERLNKTIGELVSTKADLEKELANRVRLESDVHSQLKTAKAEAAKSEAAIKEKEARCEKLEKEVADLRETRDDLQIKFKAEQQAATKSQREIKDLEGRLEKSTADLEKAKAELTRHSAERSRLTSESHEQLKAAKARTAQVESELEEKESRCRQLEKDLGKLESTRDDLQKQLASEKESLTKAQHEIKGLQEKFARSSEEWKRLEFQWRSQLQIAQSTGGQTVNVLKEKEARCHQLEQELAGWRKMRDELQAKLAAEQQAASKAQEDLEKAVAEMQQAKTELSKQSSERFRLETEVHDQLKVAKAHASKAEAALKEKESRCEELEKELAKAQEQRDQLQGRISTGQQSASKTQQEISELTKSLSQTTAELQRTKAQLEETTKELSSRAENVSREKDARAGDMEKDLAAAQKARDELQSKLTAEQQAVEKAQAEIKEIKERLKRTKASLDEQAATCDRLEWENRTLTETKNTLSQGLRRLQESQAARESELMDRQKKLVEALREEAQHFQARLQDADLFKNVLGPRKPEPAEPASAKSKSAKER